MWVSRARLEELLERISGLEDRSTELELNFIDPDKRFADTRFERYIKRNGGYVARDVESLLYKFMQHLGYMTTTYSTHTEIEKLKINKKGAKK